MLVRQLFWHPRAVHSQTAGMFMANVANRAAWEHIITANTSSKEINKIINSLKNKNSSEYDEITTKTIKISKPFIISRIIKICNKMLAQGIYPERLKIPIN
jgi:hypothetical protein